MGVPKFFRYTSERYPCLNELVKQYQIPDFDNMYLDMNGIIHNCSHPDDSNPHFRITEEKIFSDIFHYISILFQIIKPKKLFFMAIDGVAPRAKMNQQRGRRFRSAREAEKLEEEAKKKGEVLPTEERFDSNCITPGTVFMARLHEQLRYFVKMKMTTDPLWAKVKVVLSGHETPGEGEHKIMDYIRWSRSQPDYDPNTRHCLYGLDADLIMLGMCTHEPHFALLREEVKFGKTTQRATSPEETNFYLLHLSLLREYLEQEFISIKDKLPFPFDIEKIVDDWVLMGFLVGNDFIPHLPNMQISNDALPLLYKTYMTVLPTLDGYINEAGDLNLRRFEIFMQELAKIDKEKFQDTYADLKYFEGKTGRRPNANERREYKPSNDETFNVDIDDIKANKPDDELQALINATHDMFLDGIEDIDDEYEETSDEEANFEMEFILHKKDYYMNKLDYSKVTDAVLADQAEGYVRAIQWNLFYYYKGCPSWCWYYPHHYAPYISDIKGFKDLKIEFELGEPFKPFEQLLAVLPAASKQLLPTPFHHLMTDEDSSIVQYYPVQFETDLNGKINEWEAVVLIPFIDEANLLAAMQPCYEKLTEEELKRNTHGPMMVYNWSSQSQGSINAPEYFPPIENCHAIETPVWRQELDVPEDQLKKGMLPNAKRDMLFPGFPTMRHLKYKTYKEKRKVKVFDYPSRNENMIVELIRDAKSEPPLEDIARQLLGKTIWAGWPHLTRAKIISVSNEKMRLHHVDQMNTTDGAANFSTEMNAGNLHKQWLSERSTVIEHNMNRLGIELGDVNVLIHAVNLRGYKYVIQDNVQMVSEPVWCTVPCCYAYQAIVTDVSAYIIQESGKFSTPQEAYPPGDQVFLLTQGQYYGCLATIVESESIKSSRIRVQVSEQEEPIPAVNSVPSPYRSANHAAAACGISAQMLSRITGAVLVVNGERNDLPTESQNKLNIGLNLKFNKKNQEVSGYTRRCLVTNSWLYSGRCIELVRNYGQKFPELFEKLTYSINNDIYFEGDLWPHNVGRHRHLLYSRLCRGCMEAEETPADIILHCKSVSEQRTQFLNSPETMKDALKNIKHLVDFWTERKCENKPQEVVQWLKSQTYNNAQRREFGSEALEPEEMKALAATMDSQLLNLKNKDKKVTLNVKWNLLYKPELHEGNIAPDPKADFKMYDRVVCVAKNITVPIGAKGTITAVYKPTSSNTVRLSDKLNSEPSYQVMFDEPFPGAVTEDLFDDARFYRMLPSNMLSISYGRKLRGAIGSTRVDNQEYMFNQTPTLLRKDDGHNSAFANYSPTRENKTPVIETPYNLDKELNRDNGTMLLRSLLKISQSESELTEDKMASEQNKNWRVKNDNNAQGAPPQRTQNANWRGDRTGPPNVNRTPPQPSYSDWRNRNYKNEQATPPNTNYAQSFQGPGPAQIPFPHFQNPNYQPRDQGSGFQRNQDMNQRNPQNNPYQNRNYVQNQQQHHQQQQHHHQQQQYHQQQHPQQQHPQQQHPQQHSQQQHPQHQHPQQQHPQQQYPQQHHQQQAFPKNLPSVSGANLSQGPSWFNPQDKLPQVFSKVIQPPGPNNNADKVSNPFVPLQVQTSQRRSQNTSGVPNRGIQTFDSLLRELPAPRPVMPQPGMSSSPAAFQQPDSTSSSGRPQKKRKPRIAANLPFQLDDN